MLENKNKFCATIPRGQRSNMGAAKQLRRKLQITDNPLIVALEA